MIYCKCYILDIRHYLVWNKNAIWGVYNWLYIDVLVWTWVFALILDGFDGSIDCMAIDQLSKILKECIDSFS